MTQHKKIVEWSEENKAFIGSAPPIVGRCCHGDNELAVFEQLIGIVEQWEVILSIEAWSKAVFEYMTTEIYYVSPGTSGIMYLTYHSCACVTTDIGQILYRDNGLVTTGRHRSVAVAPIGYQYVCSAFGSTS